MTKLQEIFLPRETQGLAKRAMTDQRKQQNQVTSQERKTLVR